jgi:AcrR family transcriptional regulator
MTQYNVSTTTLKRQRQARKEVMIERALELFLINGIESTTMNDVAAASSSGIASAFRYFETKHHLVVATATLLWERLSLEVSSSIPQPFETYTGLEQVAFMLSLFKSFYVKKPQMFRFLEQFDNYVIAHQLSEELLDGYEDKVLWFQPSMMAMIDKGKHDQSIRTEY